MNDNFVLIGVALIMFFAVMLAVAAPISILLTFAFLLSVVVVAVASLRHFGIIAPMYAQMAMMPATNVTGMLPAQPQSNFSEYVQHLVNALPVTANDKNVLYRFTMQSDQKLAALMQSEKLPVVLTGVTFGGLTVTFRLRLYEMSRINLDRLMKSDELIAQALAVETARLTQRTGYIDCEVSSPVRVSITGQALARHTTGTSFTFGLDTELRPVLIDIAQHGLIAAIAPPRRGKSQAIRTMLYLLKRVDPEINLVVIGFKTVDWAAFGNVARLIFDPVEITIFTQWMLAEMYRRAKQPDGQRWIIVVDDLVNLLATNPQLSDALKQFSVLGAGVGVTTVVTTQFTGKSAGGTDVFANASCRLLFKPSSNLQGARDGGFAGLGLDQLSSQRGDALLVVDGDSIRIATAMTDDSDIERLTGDAPDPVWLDQNQPAVQPDILSAVKPDEFAQLIKQHGEYIQDQFDGDTGKFLNRTEAIKKFGWSYNGRNSGRLAEFEAYISGQP